MPQGIDWIELGGLVSRVKAKEGAHGRGREKGQEDRAGQDDRFHRPEGTAEVGAADSRQNADHSAEHA